MQDDSSLLTGPSANATDEPLNAKFTKDLLKGIPLLGNQGFTNEEKLLGEPSPSVKVDPFIKSKEKRRYEFTFVYAGRLHSAVLWDYDIISAAERVLCHPVEPDRIQQSRTGNCFLVADDGTQWAIYTTATQDNLTVFPTPTVDPSELPGYKRPKLKPLTTDAILEGLT